MKIEIAFFDSKEYDRQSFETANINGLMVSSISVFRRPDLHLIHIS